MFVNFIKVNWQFIFNGILAVFRLFGLCPIYIDDAPQARSGKNAFINVLLIIWSIFQFLFISTITFCVCISFMHDQSGELANFNNMLTYSTTALTHGIILVESAIVCKNFIAIWQNVRVVDELISTAIVDEYDEMLRGFYKRTVIKIIGYVFTTVLLELVVVCNILDDKYWTFMWCACILPLTVSRLRHLQHLLVIDVLACRFRVIKRELKAIVRLTKLEDNALIVKNRAFYEGLFSKISSIKKVYNLLWETSLLINRSFGFSQLSNLLQNFVQLTCDLYEMYSFLYVNALQDIPAIVFQICPTLVVVVLVLKACEVCLEEVRYIGFLLHCIEKDIDDERINTLTENFSLQILHEPLVFSVSGFFSMDFMFLKTMIASITTYMVIFIQFMPKSDEQSPANGTNITATTKTTTTAGVTGAISTSTVATTMAV